MKGGKPKKGAKKAQKLVKKTIKKAVKKATVLKKKITKEGKRVQAKVKLAVKGKVDKGISQKDDIINKLKEDLAQKEKLIRDNEKTLEETIETAGQEVSELQKKTNHSILEMKSRAEADIRKMKEELEGKSRALRGKLTELEEYRKSAEAKIGELQTRVKEFTVKVGLVEKERPRSVTFQRNPLTLLGPELRVGDRAAAFQVIDNSMQPVTLESFKSKIKIITAVPSLDTPVCDMETRRFNEEAGKLPEKVAVLTISMDLPFAQARWCAAAGVDKVKTFSDYRDRSFGSAYGVLIKELKLLARSVFVVDEQDFVRYVELVPEITQQPDYDRVLSAVRALL